MKDTKVAKYLCHTNHLTPYNQANPTIFEKGDLSLSLSLFLSLSHAHITQTTMYSGH